jgi:hypothetical protein
MSRRSRLLILLSLAALPAAALRQPEMPLLSAGEIPGLEIRNLQQFAGKALYGYIDGGADLYYEYGFDRLAVQEVALNGEAYWIEVYRMSDAPGALGIFSVSHGDCAPEDSLTRFSCFSPYALQWALSGYFVRIANGSGSPGAQGGALQLARALTRKIRPSTVEIPTIPAAAGATPANLLFVRGVLGMQNGFDRWSRLVEGMSAFEAYIVFTEDDRGETTVAEFRCTEQSDLKRLSAAFSDGNGKFRRAQKRGDRRLVVLESDAPADSLWSKIKRLP